MENVNGIESIAIPEIITDSSMVSTLESIHRLSYAFTLDANNDFIEDFTNIENKLSDVLEQDISYSDAESQIKAIYKEMGILTIRELGFTINDEDIISLSNIKEFLEGVGEYIHSKDVIDNFPIADGDSDDELEILLDRISHHFIITSNPSELIIALNITKLKHYIDQASKTLEDPIDKTEIDQFIYLLLSKIPELGKTSAVNDILNGDIDNTFELENYISNNTSRLRDSSSLDIDTIIKELFVIASVYYLFLKKMTIKQVIERISITNYSYYKVVEYKTENIDKIKSGLIDYIKSLESILP